MAKIITIGHLITASKEARDTVVKVFEDIVEYSRANEPGVTMYAITVPRNDDGTTIYMIEEYADKTTSDTHIASQPVQKLINLFTSEPVLAGAPNVYQLEPVYSFIKPEIKKVAGPYITFANVSYNSGDAEQSLSHWEGVVSTSENASGSLLYAVCKDAADTDKLHTVEVYENKDQESVVKPRDQVSSLVQVSLKMIGGFFHR